MLATANHVQPQQHFDYALGIEKPYGVIDEVLTWCRQSLRDEWAWQLVEPGRYIFYFNNDQDHFAFALKWY